MSFLEYRLKTVPIGFRKILHLNWVSIGLMGMAHPLGATMMATVNQIFFYPVPAPSWPFITTMAASLLTLLKKWV